MIRVILKFDLERIVVSGRLVGWKLFGRLIGGRFELAFDFAGLPIEFTRRVGLKSFCDPVFSARSLRRIVAQCVSLVCRGFALVKRGRITVNDSIERLNLARIRPQHLPEWGFPHSDTCDRRRGRPFWRSFSGELMNAREI